MKHFSLNLEALSPLAIRSDHAAGGANSAAYISGTALAGSLATVYRLYYPDNTTDFKQLFLSGEVQYPDLYPAMFKPMGMRDAIDYPVYPFPKTAQSCKRFPGFSEKQGDESDEEYEPHGIRDSLMDWAAFELAKQANERAKQANERAKQDKKDDQLIDITALLQPLEAHKKCPVCEKPMDHIPGFYRRNPDSGEMAKASDENRLQTHTGINRETGTVQEGILYNRLVFVEHTRFWGMVKLPEQLVSPFQSFLKEVGQTGLVRIGTGRTRGMGKVNLSVIPIEDDEKRLEQFKERLQAFNEKLHTQVKEAFPNDAGKLALQPFYFALTLHSPAILCDAMLRYRGSIDAHVLEDLLKISHDNFTLVYQAASTRRVSGWNELWGLPRTNEYAIDTGSVFLFGSHIDPDDDKGNALWQALFNLEEEGIGRRKAEGYGRVCVSDQFHQEVELP